MGIYITKIVLNKNYFKSILLTIAKKHMVITCGAKHQDLNFPPITSSYCNCVLKKAFMLSCEITVPLS